MLRQSYTHTAFICTFWLGRFELRITLDHVLLFIGIVPAYITLAQLTCEGISYNRYVAKVYLLCFTFLSIVERAMIQRAFNANACLSFLHWLCACLMCSACRSWHAYTQTCTERHVRTWLLVFNMSSAPKIPYSYISIYILYSSCNAGRIFLYDEWYIICVRSFPVTSLPNVPFKYIAHSPFDNMLWYAHLGHVAWCHIHYSRLHMSYINANMILPTELHFILKQALFCDTLSH